MDIIIAQNVQNSIQIFYNLLFFECYFFRKLRLLFCVYRSNDFSTKTAGQQFAQQTEELVLRSRHTYRLALLLCDFCNVCTNYFWAGTVLLILFHLADASGNTTAVLFIANDHLLPCLRETSVDISQFNRRHLNAVRLHFVIQGA